MANITETFWNCPAETFTASKLAKHLSLQNILFRKREVYNLFHESDFHKAIPAYFDALG